MDHSWCKKRFNDFTIVDAGGIREAIRRRVTSEELYGSIASTAGYGPRVSECDSPRRHGTFKRCRRHPPRPLSRVSSDLGQPGWNLSPPLFVCVIDTSATLCDDTREHISASLPLVPLTAIAQASSPTRAPHPTPAHTVGARLSPHVAVSNVQKSSFVVLQPG